MTMDTDMVNTSGWVDHWNKLSLLPPEALQQWMEYRESITELAKQRFNDVHVKLIQEGWVYPALEEAHSLNQSGETLVFIREIFMECDGENCWYARTVIPSETYEKYRLDFEGLGSTPLGSLLYNREEVHRSAFQFIHLTPRLELHQQLLSVSQEAVAESLWARRSVFHLEKSPLLLQEIFLPSLIKALC